MALRAPRAAGHARDLLTAGQVRKGALPAALALARAFAASTECIRAFALDLTFASALVAIAGIRSGDLILSGAFNANATSALDLPPAVAIAVAIDDGLASTSELRTGAAFVLAVGAGLAIVVAPSMSTPAAFVAAPPVCPIALELAELEARGRARLRGIPARAGRNPHRRRGAGAEEQNRERGPHPGGQRRGRARRRQRLALVVGPEQRHAVRRDPARDERLTLLAYRGSVGACASESAGSRTSGVSSLGSSTMRQP